MNGFIINEDDQFEIAAIKNIKTTDCEDQEQDALDKLIEAMQAVDKLTELQNQGSPSNESLTNQLHFLWANSYSSMLGIPGISYSIISYNLKLNANLTKRAMKMFNHESSMVSCLCLKKVNCVTKEKIDIQYENKKENEQRQDLSVGEDLETLIERIKNGEISKEKMSKAGESKRCLLFRLLDKEERRKLDEERNEDFFRTFLDPVVNKYPGPWNPDVPDHEWKATNYKHLKFSQSWFTRRTNCIDIVNEPADNECVLL